MFDVTVQNFRCFICFIVYTSLVPIASSASEQVEFFGKIKSYADLADAAYLPEQDVQTIVEAQGYKLDQYSSVPGVEVNYFIATSEVLKQHVISVRGTANVENAIVDVSLKLLPDEHANIKLHQGFAQAAEGVYKAMLSKLNKDYEISVTGHSLGGAVAVILAMYLDIDQYTLGSIITFGQPKVTNVSGTQEFRHLDVIRVVTAQDLVPLVPPLDVMDIRKLDIYWHLGKEIVLLEGREYAELQGIKSMMRATKVINTRFSQENLAHHKMVGYLESVKHKVDEPNLVVYDTDIDLLKLFGR